MPPRSRVIIVQPYVPRYRVAFYRGLRQVLDRHGMELVVAAGVADPTQARRADAAGAMDVQLPTRWIRFAGRRIALRRLGALRAQQSDLVIVEQALANIETYRLMTRRHRAESPQVAMWGHGATYVKPRLGLEHWALKRLTNLADWFFAYTPNGARHVVAGGFPDGRVSVVWNTTDTVRLGALRSSAVARAPELAEALGIGDEPSALYIGALDQPKRIEFLLEAAESIAGYVRSFKLIVAGAGELEALVRQRAAEQPWLVYAGIADEPMKVALAALARIMLVPGRVGLVALDSFALELPIVTTGWSYHAPEFEYLEHDRNAIIARDNLDDYVDSVVQLLRNDELRERLRMGCRRDATRYTMEAMVDNFSAGVVQALAAGPRVRT